ncbi:MAG: hypothetical protein RL616_1517 [Verrucomicrobiota bacterium]|jgi:uncharacterized membrane protein
MNKVIGIILLVVGVFLLVRGHDISQSVGGQLQNVASRITGATSGQATQYYLGGAVCCAVGLVLTFFLPSKK